MTNQDGGAIEIELRQEWWLNHGVNCQPYGDDGEMQCCANDLAAALKETPE
jgi:hypothetical protein